MLGKKKIIDICNKIVHTRANKVVEYAGLFSKTLKTENAHVHDM